MRIINKNAKLLLIAFSSFSINICLCQSFYTGIDLSYGMGLASQNLTSNTTIGVTQTSHSLVIGSFGQGASINAYFGYLQNQHISFELGITYLQSHGFRGSAVKDTSYKQDLALSANMLRLAPTIRFTVGEKKTKLYLKAGLLIRLAGKITNESTYYDLLNGTVIQTEWKYSKGLSLGASGGLGLIRNFNTKSAIYCELFFNAQTWGPKNGNVVTYRVNGVDKIATLNPSQRNTHYLNNYNSGGNNANYNYDQQLRQYFPFSSIGIKLGYQLAFGKNKEK